MVAPQTNSRPAIGLLRACHPLPCVGVTAFTTALAVVAGNDAPTCVIVAAAVLTGQLTIGWSNDYLDRQTDEAVGRQDKPIATGQVSAQTIRVAILLAGAACIVLSLMLGWRAGLLHLGAVACGWIYNLWLKRTWLSWLPYSLAFGALPGIATFALPGHPAPPAWAVIAGALLGACANLTNALPDVEDDAATQSGGVASRLGARAAVVLAQFLLVAATAFIAAGPPGPPSAAAWTGLALTILVVAASAPTFWRRAQSRVPFYGVMVLVAIDIGLIMLSGQNLP